MNELDQTILITAAPEAVWAFVSDINQNPAWQSDCQNVVFLSKQRSGKGTRWRYRNLAGREFELEITAWYDGLGYEYRFLDGSAHGRLRLQEIAEGTTVQWTFSYEPRGRLGGMRNALGRKRSYRKYMDESLQSLQATVKRAAGEDPAYIARSLMRDAISYDARMNYRPRHPSLMRDPDDPVPVLPLPIEEPPLLEEDTKPNPAFAALSPDSPQARQPVEAEPLPQDEDLETPQPRTPRPGQLELSIWDVFGVERPPPVESEPEQEAPPPEPAREPPPTAPAPIMLTSEVQVLGLGHPGMRRLQRARQFRRAGPS